jgi:uncharacterized protein YndB with AHSA1/START domain
LHEAFLMVLGRIDREIVVEAPVQTVWEVLTTPAHICRWFSDEAEVETWAGGRGRLTWHEHGAYNLRVVAADEPHRFAFLWIRRPGVEPDEENSTLVDMRLTAQGQATRLRVIESGFADLPWPEGERAAYEEENRQGWDRELLELEAYLASLGLASHP